NNFEVSLDFVVMTGDLVDVLPSDELTYYDENDNTSIHQLKLLLDELDMPFHLALGNHDYYTDDGFLDSHTTPDKSARESLFQDQLDMPAPWYRFDHEGLGFIVLNSMQDDARVDWAPGRCGSFGEVQLAWLEEELKKGDPCFLFFHHPLALDVMVSAGAMAFFAFEVPRSEGDYEKYEDTVFEDWTDPIYDLLQEHADQVQGVFVGHGHWFVQDYFEGIPVMMTDSVGNSYQGTAIDVDGEDQPMRYHIVECNLTKNTMTIYNESHFIYNA
ncbi:MAG: hypothetical protein HN348_35375, partial [Proteobacteria bacterium]|nr:hypothetical protein [Pseudomonadota bacterium]